MDTKRVLALVVWCCAVLVVSSVLVMAVRHRQRGKQEPAADRIGSFAVELRLSPDGEISVFEQISLILHEPRESAIDRHLTKPEKGPLPTYSMRLMTDGTKAVLFPHGPRADGYHVLLGYAGQPLSPGSYAYSLQYGVSSLVVEQGAFQSMRWNVTGSAPVPIMRAELLVRLPRSINPAVVRVTPWIDGRKTSEPLPPLSVVLQDDGSWLVCNRAPLQRGESMLVQLKWPREQGVAPAESEDL